ncbi:MAG: aminoglycoside phosphotransferase family protein [Flavobacteriaceae bacterium]|nr:aminoglycoside phosphotransferase family protein [Bacteroidia bacterium]NNK87118.1 aminoglycoside phosphotransferase family protein [Flavobacteriaceae bacterium]
MDIRILTEVLKGFGILSDELSFVPIEHGYINDTSRVDVSGTSEYILQRINHQVFHDPEKIQKNIDLALDKLNHETYHHLEYLRSTEGRTLFKLGNSRWRIMRFVKDSRVFNTTDSREIAFEAGRIVGLFHKLTEDENPGAYEITLPNFHNLGYRFREFINAIDFADHLTLMEASAEVNFANANFPVINVIFNSELPLRICHNDTKLNNFLFNSENKALCLIDLDTIMPGFLIYDIGDAVRTIANPASEDETDLSKIDFDVERFGSFIKGLKSSGVALERSEIESLPLAIAYMPFIHGLRALTDYLNGNIYYKVNYAEHNLDRAKNLFKFTSLALQKKDLLWDLTNRVFG